MNATATVTPRPVPATWILVILNAVLFTTYLTWSAEGPVAFIVIPVITTIYVLVSGLWQWLMVACARRWHWRMAPAARLLVFLLPLAGYLVLSSSLPEPPREVNRKMPAISRASGAQAFVTSRSAHWAIRIKGQDGAEFQETTDFVSNLNVYWIWDAQDRLWIYNSDDGSVHFWAREGTTWRHTVWGARRRTPDAPGGRESKNTNPEIQPPEELFPHRAKALR